DGASRRHRPAHRQAHGPRPDRSSHRDDRRLRARSRDARAARRPRLPPSSARPRESRERLVISNRSTRPARLRSPVRGSARTRGLPVLDSLVRNPLPLDVDLAVLRTRSDGLRALADNTDGIAAVSSNDLARSFKRIVDDLSSYYLLGYYSSGRLDGRFHSITV